MKKRDSKRGLQFNDELDSTASDQSQGDSWHHNKDSGAGIALPSMPPKVVSPEGGQYRLNSI